MVTNQTYGRGQAEWALWNSFIVGRGISDDVPKVFRTRIKRLLDVDRTSEFLDAAAPTPARWSFVAPPDSKGSEAAYSKADVFCLAVGLDLLDSGFKQSEVVFTMRYLRPELESRMAGFLKRPSLLDRRNHEHEAHKDLPYYSRKGKKYADPRQFVILSKIEFREIVPQNRASKEDTPLVLAPEFCNGVEELSTHLGQVMPQQRRVLSVLELVSTAQATATFLDKAPIIQRGRPKS